MTTEPNPFIKFTIADASDAEILAESRRRNLNTTTVTTLRNAVADALTLAADVRCLVDDDDHAPDVLNALESRRDAIAVRAGVKA